MLSLILISASICTYTPASATENGSTLNENTSEKEQLISSSVRKNDLTPILEDVSEDETEAGNSVKNEAIVTLAVPNGESSPLLKEGTFSADKRIYIRDVMDFGDAGVLDPNGDGSGFSGSTFFAVHVSSSVCSTEKLIDILSPYTYVESVSPNYRLETADADPLLREQWYLNDETYTATTSHTDVSSDADISYKKEDLNLIPTTGNPPIVAVVDTGVDYTHEDLKDKMWINPYPSLPGVYGYDFCNDREDPFPNSILDTHGTGVAGVIAASTDNGVGISGVSRDAKIMSLKIFDSDNENNSGTHSAQLAAFEYAYKAKKLGANIVALNCSFCIEPSANPYSSIGDKVVGQIDAAVKRLGEEGILVVYAAGNAGENIEKKPYGMPYQQDQTYLLVTGATTYKGDMAKYSNYGTEHVHLMAPGSTILTTTHRDNFLPSSYDAEKKNRLCMFCDDFNSKDRSFLRVSNNSSIAVSHSTEDIHGDAGSGSNVVTIKNAYSSDSDDYMIYYDVTDYPINYDGSSSYYFSFVCSTSNPASWYDMSGRLGANRVVQAWRFTTTNHYYISINIKKLLGGDALYNGLKVYFDSFSLSVANPDVRDFGRYTYANGTSFSAPCVSGAVARLASTMPGTSASYKKQFILENVSKKSEFSDKCSSGGSLNLAAFPTTVTNIDNPKVNATGIKLNKTKAKLKVGKKLKLKATILPSDASNKRVIWKVSNKSYASVSKKGVVKAKKKGRGHTVKVTAVSKANKKLKAVCKIKIR